MRLTGAHITPTCRANRSTDGAWNDAVARMREVYDAQLARSPDATITLWIARDEPEAAVAYRSAESGRFVTAEEAAADPAHTVREEG